jgi:flagellum-specific peptidoglycan hydrolase FlgJ
MSEKDRARTRAWLAVHGEERNERRRAQYATDPQYAERERARVRAYAVAHRDEINERARERYDRQHYGDSIPPV